MPSVLRESTDASAPILTAEVGSLIHVLKKVLVDGYGDKTALGWSIMLEDEDVNECVFRANSGTRFPIKISDNRDEPRSAFVKAYESMSDINTGYGMCPFTTDIEHSCILKSSNNSGSAPIPWKIIGDDKGFWFITKASHAQYPDNIQYSFWFPHYFGDYTALSIQNKYNFMTLTQRSDSYEEFKPSATHINTLSVIRDPATFEPGCVTVAPLGAFSGYLFGNNMGSYGVSPMNGKYIYEKPVVLRNNIPIGTIPGFLNMWWRSSAVLTTDYYPMNAAEVEPFFDIKSDTEKIFVFPMRYVNHQAATNGHGVQRGSIIIGDSFRNAN